MKCLRWRSLRNTLNFSVHDPGAVVTRQNEQNEKKKKRETMEKSAQGKSADVFNEVKIKIAHIFEYFSHFFSLWVAFSGSFKIIIPFFRILLLVCRKNSSHQVVVVIITGKLLRIRHSPIPVPRISSDEKRVNWVLFSLRCAVRRNSVVKLYFECGLCLRTYSFYGEFRSEIYFYSPMCKVSNHLIYPLARPTQATYNGRCRCKTHTRTRFSRGKR